MFTGGSAVPLHHQVNVPLFSQLPTQFALFHPESSSSTSIDNSRTESEHLTALSSSRIKLRRSRQRVDAGEPRNTYQAVRSPMLQQRFTSGFHYGNGTEEGPSLNILFPWMNAQTSSQLANDAELIKEYDIAQDLSQHNTETEVDDQSPQKSSREGDDIESVEEEKQRLDEVGENGVEIEGDGDGLDEEKDKPSIEESSPQGSAQSGSSSCGGSSSRRKAAVPQRNNGFNDCIDHSAEPCGETEEGTNEDPSAAAKVPDADVVPSALAASLNGGFQSQHKWREMFDMQRRIYTNWMEQHRKLISANEEEQKRTHIQNTQQHVQRDFAKLAQSLKQEIVNTLTSSIDKVISEFAAAEAAANAQRAAALAEQRENASVAAMRTPFLFHPLYPTFNGHNHLSNPFLPNPLNHNGIFPSTLPTTNFNPFTQHFAPVVSTAATIRTSDEFSPFAPRKKRSKVTDSTRLNKVTSTSSAAKDGSLSDSARSSPQLSSYFPPTMVNHHMYGGTAFGSDERDSADNSDDTSECGAYESAAGASSTLTPMHLRKAKLMFFYTRYPNSALLKSYFPDIRFNKNNTAQLVKWFSNFREFFYNQMDKYARNYLAEGVKNKEEITVTPDSEIYKNLNQHYNRNNHIQPPEHLTTVIQETLREFFVAIQNGRDAEPSWKKTIYKVINRLDDPIPEYFKDPNFLERLEG